jgi:PmbA protein
MKRFAERTVRSARASGAETAEVTVIERMEFAVEARKGAIEKLIESVSSTIDVQLSVDRRKALVSSTDLSEESVAALITEGVELAPPLPWQPCTRRRCHLSLGEVGPSYSRSRGRSPCG